MLNNSVLFRKYQESGLLCDDDDDDDDDDDKIISHFIPISGVRIKVIRAGTFQGFFGIFWDFLGFLVQGFKGKRIQSRGRLKVITFLSLAWQSGMQINF